MKNSSELLAKLRNGRVCLGTGISFTDPTVTEALCSVLDYVWIDMEHTALTIEAVQAHVMATLGSVTAPLVRVAWNDPVLIKPVLDVGAAGIIVPLVRSADDVRRAVAACRYPPEGIRGYGPRRPSHYGRMGGPSFCDEANANVLVVVQIEHIEAVENLDSILSVPGLTSVVVGAMDLSGSIGHMGQPRHPEVMKAIDSVVSKARKAHVFVGLATGDDPDLAIEWIQKGMQWISLGTDTTLLLRAADLVCSRIRDRISEQERPG
jgi:2-dehydro-3-deoxyglucarate aldolase/4-hydroxy-2-oxoheptanedioate aldolase